MSAKVNLSPWFSQAVGGREILHAAGSTIGECLDEIDAEYPGVKEMIVNMEGRVKSHVLLLLNGENTYPEELSKPVQDGDEISMIILADGG
jgi:molybdopterin synthase sulfur carrier subunit